MIHSAPKRLFLRCIDVIAVTPDVSDNLDMKCLLDPWPGAAVLTEAAVAVDAAARPYLAYCFINFLVEPGTTPSPILRVIRMEGELIVRETGLRIRRQLICTGFAKPCSVDYKMVRDRKKKENVVQQATGYETPGVKLADGAR